VYQHQSYFQKLTQKKLEEAFNILKRIVKPVFSGSVDHRINLLDMRKVRYLLKNPKYEASLGDMELFK